MVPLLLLSVLELPLCLPALPVPTISSKGAPPPAPVRHFPPPRAPTQRPASAAEPRAALTTYSMYSAARDAAAPPNGSSVLLFGRLLPGSCVCVSVLSAGGGVTGANEHCITFTSHPLPACLHRGKYSQGLVELAPQCHCLFLLEVENLKANDSSVWGKGGGRRRSRRHPVGLRHHFTWLKFP